MFSSLQNLSKWNEDKQVKLEEGKRHLRFCMKLYRMQAGAGRMFLHEHPLTATSWRMPEVQAVANLAGIQSVVADQCMYGLKTWGAHRGEKVPARKPTTFMTNSRAIGNQLSRRCGGEHSHQHLTDGRAKDAARYTENDARPRAEASSDRRSSTRQARLRALQWTNPL